MRFEFHHLAGFIPAALLLGACVLIPHRARSETLRTADENQPAIALPPAINMNRILVNLAVTVMVGLVICGQAFAHGYKVGDIAIAHPWARSTAAGVTAGAGYMHLKNGGTTDDRLVSVEAAVSAKVELHEATMADGIMKMRRLDDGIVLKAGAEVALEPHGLHVMFVDLTGPLVAGTRVPATLVFEKAGRVDVEFAVQVGN